jgi:hypothetical protein
LVTEMAPMKLSASVFACFHQTDERANEAVDRVISCAATVPQRLRNGGLGNGAGIVNMGRVAAVFVTVALLLAGFGSGGA